MRNGKNGKYLDFEKARRIIRSKNFKSRNEFRSYLKSNNITNIPINPNYTYEKDWISLDDWLGRCKKSHKNVDFLEYVLAEILIS